MYYLYNFLAFLELLVGAKNQNFYFAFIYFLSVKTSILIFLAAPAPSGILERFQLFTAECTPLSLSQGPSSLLCLSLSVVSAPRYHLTYHILVTSTHQTKPPPEISTKQKHNKFVGMKSLSTPFQILDLTYFKDPSEHLKCSILKQFFLRVSSLGERWRVTGAWLCSVSSLQYRVWGQSA